MKRALFAFSIAGVILVAGPALALAAAPHAALPLSEGRVLYELLPAPIPVAPDPVWVLPAEAYPLVDAAAEPSTDMFHLAALPPVDINAASCSHADITQAIASATGGSDFTTGDRVLVPQGTCTHTGSGEIVVINKKIRVQGAGQDAQGNWLTVINVDVGTSFTGHDITEAALLCGFKFVYVSAANLVRVRQSGVSACENYFEGAAAGSVGILATKGTTNAEMPYSLAHHNYFHNARVLVQGDGAGSPPGSALWRLDLRLGSDKAFYVEDNIAVFDTANLNFCDCSFGGQIVCRHNDLTDTWLEAHAMDPLSPTAAGRGCRKWEYYKNNIKQVTRAMVRPMILRAGTGVGFENPVTGTWSIPTDCLDHRRAFELDTNGFPPGACDGTSNYDGRTIAASGAVRSGNVVTITTDNPHPFATSDSVTINGVTDASFDGEFTVTVTGATTFTYSQVAGDATSGTGKASRKGWPGRDQIGRSKDVSEMTSNSGPGYDQESDPAYLWGNTLNASPLTCVTTNCTAAVKANGSCADVVNGRDYFNSTERPNYTPYRYPHELQYKTLIPRGVVTPK